LVTKLTDVLKARSAVIDGLPSGLSGSQLIFINTNMDSKNQIRLIVSKALRCCFQFISLMGSIPPSLKNVLSTGLNSRSSHVLLPSNTFPIYLPKGIAIATVSRYINRTPKISVFMSFMFRRFRRFRKFRGFI